MERNENQQPQNQQPSTQGLIPIGRYRVKRVSHDFGRSGTETEQVGVELEITADGPYKGQTLIWYGYFTEAAEETAIKGMRAIGWEGNDVRSGWRDDVEAIAVVEHERDRDNIMRAKVRWLNSIGVAMKEKMNPAELATFAKRVAGTAARLAGGGTPSGSRDLPGPSNDRQIGSGSAPQGGRGQGYDHRDFRDDRNPPPDDEEPPFMRGRGNGQQGGQGGQQGGYRR